jgi:hypothetical protein
MIPTAFEILDLNAAPDTRDDRAVENLAAAVLESPEEYLPRALARVTAARAANPGRQQLDIAAEMGTHPTTFSTAIKRARTRISALPLEAV